VSSEDIPASWVRCELSEVVDILDSQRIPVNSAERQVRLASASTTYPYYGATGQVGEIDDYIFEGESVLLGEDGAPFLDPYKPKAYMARGRYWVNNHAHILRSVGGIKNEFLCHQLNILDYKQLVSGTTRLKLTQGSLKAIPLKLAPLNEQYRIVEKIETLFAYIDKGEEALHEVQKLLKRYRQSILKAAVTGNLIGNSWQNVKEVQLGDLLLDIRYGTAKKCGHDESQTPVLRIPNVISGGIDLSNLKYTILTDAEQDKLALRCGDILLVRSNGSANLVARGAIVDEKAVDFAYAGYLIRLRIDQKKITPQFLQIALESPQMRSVIERQARSTSGVHNINSSEIKSLPIRVPSLDDQAAVTSEVKKRFSVAQDLDARCEFELQRSNALRQSILKSAFTGHLVSQDPNDERASELLARIRAERDAAPAKKRVKKKATRRKARTKA